jgi:hypothetical protein
VEDANGESREQLLGDTFKHSTNAGVESSDQVFKSPDTIMPAKEEGTIH